MKVVWLRLGLRTRRTQLDYLAELNPVAAARLEGEIDRAVEMLFDHPNLGRPGRSKDTRELVISGTPYIAVYRVRRDRVEIVRILHGAQLWPPRSRSEQ